MEIQTKNITVLQGHLTAKDKAAIKALLASGLTIGKVGRKTYAIIEKHGLYEVSYKVKDKGLIPVPGTAYRISTHSAIFKLK